MKIEKQTQILPAFKGFLEKIESKKLQQVCAELLTWDKFWTHPASTGYHHAFHHGLAVHTLEVTYNADYISKIFPVKKDILLAAALWHDWGKIWEYEMTPKGWGKTQYHKLVHHIPGSMAEFTAVARKREVDEETIQTIQHCILSHHGCAEYNTVRLPNTLEAIILHQADMLSAHSPYNTVAPV